MADTAAKLRAIDHIYRKSRRPWRSKPQLAALRLKDLARLFRARYGVSLPDDDAGRDDLAVALSHIAMLGSARDRMARFIEVWASWLTVAEAKSMTDHALVNPQRWKADQLAWRMRLTAADRRQLGITTIGAIDESCAQRIKARKQRARDRAKEWRRRKKLAAYTP